MFAFLPEDIQRGLDAAIKRGQRKSSRLSVHMDDVAYPILRLSETGFAVDATRIPPLRGFVDVFDGPRHISRALIIAASEDGGEMTYEFKSETLIGQPPIRDYVEDRPTSAGYLPSPV